VTSSFDVERFIAAVKEARKEADSQLAVQEVLARAVGDPAAVLAGVGEPIEAGIHTLHRAADLTILNVIWAPWMVLLPHEHAMWASIGIYSGREDNIVWERRGATIEAVGAEAVSERQVFGLSETAIHSVINPTRKRTGAIHIYGGDFFGTARSEWDPETLRERPFDLEAARRMHREADERSAKPS
jgi:predicted metal-dependent enzyme (double-stranded beta helix superfamily)